MRGLSPRRLMPASGASRRSPPIPATACGRASPRRTRLAASRSGLWLRTCSRVGGSAPFPRARSTTTRAAITTVRCGRTTTRSPPPGFALRAFQPRPSWWRGPPSKRGWRTQIAGCLSCSQASSGRPARRPRITRAAAGHRTGAPPPRSRWSAHCSGSRPMHRAAGCGSRRWRRRCGSASRSPGSTSAAIVSISRLRAAGSSSARCREALMSR